MEEGNEMATPSPKLKPDFTASGPVTAPVQVLTAAEEGHPIELRGLSFQTPETGTLALAAGQVGVKGADGKWRGDVLLPPIRLDDLSAAAEAEAETEAAEGAEPRKEQYPASRLINFILSSKVDGTDPLAVYYAIPDGTPLSQALPAVIYWQIPAGP